MDIRAAIVEDEKNIADNLKRSLLQWEETAAGRYEVNVHLFPSGNLFRQSAKVFDVIFLDIELETRESGLKIAQELREQGNQTPIVFITSHKDKMFFGYKVRALDFLVKPVRQSEINWCMEQVTGALAEQYYIHAGREPLRIAYRDIYYFESRLHYIRIVARQGEWERIGTIQQLMTKLPPEFVRCHRSYIINLNCVVSLSSKAAHLSDGEWITVSPTYQEHVRKMYLRKMPF